MSPNTVKVHPLPVRITHWVNALAILIMLMSGWRIYNASPLFGWVIPEDITLGGWLGGALQWHFAAMWMLALNGLLYVAYGLASGHLRRRMLPIAPRALVGDLRSALRGKLSHANLAVYNAAQKTAYLGAILLVAGLILSGLAIWKPVQLHWLAAPMGDFEGARMLHFFCMAGIVLFVLVHLAMVILVPKTFLTMITGKLRHG